MKEIDIKEIIEKHWQEYCKNTDYEYFEEAIKDAVNQALDMAEEKAQELFDENAGAYDGRLITPTVVREEILSIKERVK